MTKKSSEHENGKAYVIIINVKAICVTCTLRGVFLRVYKMSMAMTLIFKSFSFEGGKRNLIKGDCESGFCLIRCKFLA